jgi:hypothetical protein
VDGSLRDNGDFVAPHNDFRIDTFLSIVHHVKIITRAPLHSYNHCCSLILTTRVDLRVEIAIEVIVDSDEFNSPFARSQGEMTVVVAVPFSCITFGTVEAHFVFIVRIGWVTCIKTKDPVLVSVLRENMSPFF